VLAFWTVAKDWPGNAVAFAIIIGWALLRYSRVGLFVVIATGAALVVFAALVGKRAKAKGSKKDTAG
jgi:hypothetical protein